MVKLILLSGFLGAGKTTLMSNILDSFTDEKVGLIVNEFGETGVDGTLLARNGVKMAELNNGSIFCACLKASFLKSLIDMSGQDISYLFVEPSGLADPSEMGRILDGIAHLLHTEYDYRGVISVIDAETFPNLSRVLPALVRQVEYCSAAIINKADLVTSDQLKQVSNMITRINPNCEIIVTSYCDLDIRALAEKLSQADIAPRDSTNTTGGKPYSLVLKPKGNVSVYKLREFIEKLSPEYAYRIKGFLPTQDGVIVVSAVGGIVNIETWSGDVPTLGLVVISAIGLSIISKIADTIGALDGNLSL